MPWKVSQRLACAFIGFTREQVERQCESPVTVSTPISYRLGVWLPPWFFFKQSPLFQRSSLHLPPEGSDLSLGFILTSFCSKSQDSSLVLPAIFFLLCDRLASSLHAHPPPFPYLSHITPHLAPKVQFVPGAFSWHTWLSAGPHNWPVSDVPTHLLLETQWNSPPPPIWILWRYFTSNSDPNLKL